MSFLSMVGMLGAGALSSAGQMYANSQNIQFQDQANSEAINLSNTAHQREVRDLLAAGLNPVLSAGGAGASVPSLGVAGVSNSGQGVADGISSAANLVSDQYKAQVNNIKANTYKANADTTAVHVHNSLVDQQRENEIIRGHILEQERGAGIYRSYNDRLENAAISEAITGRRLDSLDDEINWNDKKAVKAYNDLVQKYRNKIELERYLNSKERQMLLDGVSTANDIKSLKSSKHVIHDHYSKGNTSRHVIHEHYMKGKKR